MILAIVLLLLLPLTAMAQQCTQTQLNTEFTTDPTARGYSACANDQCVLDKFNAPCTGNPACKVDNVLSREAFIETIIDSSELEKLARSTVANDNARKSQLGWMLSATSYNLGKGSLQQKWKNIFTNTDSPITNAAIVAAQQKDAPRSQIVCGRSANLDDISCGLRGVECP